MRVLSYRASYSREAARSVSNNNNNDNDNNDNDNNNYRNTAGTYYWELD